MLSKYQVGQLGIVLAESELLRSPARTSCAPPLWTPGTLARRQRMSGGFTLRDDILTALIGHFRLDFHFII